MGSCRARNRPAFSLHDARTMRPRSNAAVERTMMTSLNARRLARLISAPSARSVLLALMALSPAARADAVDDTLAKFLDDKFPQTDRRNRRTVRRGASTGRSHSGGARRQPPHDRSRRSYRRLQDRRRRAAQRQDGRADSRFQRRRLQEGPRQQRASQRHPRRDGVSHPRQLPIPRSASRRPKTYSRPTTPRRCRRFRPSSPRKATRASPRL